MTRVRERSRSSRQRKIAELRQVGTMQSRRFSGLPLIGIFAIIYFIAGKTRLTPGVIERECVAGVATRWNRAGCNTLARLSSVAGDLCWCVPGKRHDRGKSSATSFAIATGNTVEAVAGAWLVNRFAGGKNVFDRPQGVFKFALAAAISTVDQPSLWRDQSCAGRLCRLDELRRDLADMVARRYNRRSHFHSAGSSLGR